MQRLATVFLLVLGFEAARAQLLSGITTELTTAEGDVMDAIAEDLPTSSGTTSTETSATSNLSGSSISTAVME